jgi:hypothetical protein
MALIAGIEWTPAVIGSVATTIGSREKKSKEYLEGRR